MMTGKVRINCPAMPILATLEPWIRQCQELHCPSNEIILEDGTSVSFVITLPRALVRWQSPGHWLIDEVPAKGETKDGRPIHVTQPRQNRAHKTEFVALQASARGGVVKVRVTKDRAFLGARAVTVMRGRIAC